jgi:hypothetical protein
MSEPGELGPGLWVVLEADLALLWPDSIYGERHEGALFGECKTFGEFNRADFERMRYLAKCFPGAVLVFATLRKTLTAREVSAITRIVKAGPSVLETRSSRKPGSCPDGHRAPALACSAWMLGRRDKEML